jgi:outer membrane receptor for ferrienterochelin and colicins
MTHDHNRCPRRQSRDHVCSVLRRATGIGAACVATVFAIAHSAGAQTANRSRGADSAAVTAAKHSAPLSLNTIVVTAARREQTLKDTPVATELITHEEIQRTGASDLATVLTQQIGISPASGTPSGSGVTLDGLGQERVLILLDGEPLEGRLAGSFDLSRIPTSIIDHVEIVNGPQSMLYGSDAMGGVINIITRPATTRTTASAEVLGGTQGRLDASAQMSGGTGALTFSGSAGHRDLDLTPGLAQSSGGYARRWDGLGTMRWAPDSSFALTTSAFFVDEHQQFTSAPTAFLSENIQLNLRERALWKWGRDSMGRATQRLAPSISYSEFNHLPSTRSTDTSGTATGEDEHEVERLLKGDIVYTAAFGVHELTAGIDAQREEFSSTRLTGNGQAVASFDPFIEGTIVLGQLSLVPGVRLTDNEQWGTHWTPRLAVLYRPIDALAFRASASTGFRSPDLEEQHLDFVNTEPGAGYEVLGNPNLQPETSRNLSLSVEWSGASAYARLEGFDTHYTNFIDYQYVGMQNGLIEFTYANADNGEVRGLDFTGGIVAGRARFDVGYGLARTSYTATSSPLLGIPGQTARLSGSYTFPFGLAVTLTSLYTGSAPLGSAQDGSGPVTQGAFTRVNALAVQSMSNDWQLIVGADNLLNAQAINWPEASARRIYGGVRWQLGSRGALR